MGKEIDPEKLRDMIRSILPSTIRKRARELKAMENRAARRTGREADLRSVVWDRRAHDKLNHFMRWCEAITDGLSDEEKLEAVRALLPRTLIGYHAFTHWELHVTWRSGRPHHVDAAQSRYESLRVRLRRALTEAPDLLGWINAEIKARKLLGEPRRMLFGIHDVDAFARDVLDGPFKTERRVAEEAIESGRPNGRPRHAEARRHDGCSIVMCRGAKLLRAGKQADELRRVVDDDRQMLRADVNRPAAVLHRDQRHAVGRAFADEAMSVVHAVYGARARTHAP